MGNPVTSSNNSTFLAAEYLEERVGLEAAAKVVVAPLVFQTDTINQETLTAHLRNEVAFATASTASEGSALTVTTWATGSTTISAGLDGFAVQESKVYDSISPNTLDRIARQGSTALARTIDASLTALFPSLTAGTVGTLGSTLTLADITTGIANLDAQNAQGTKHGVIHPHQWANLVSDIVSKNYGVSAVRPMLDPDTGQQIEVLELEGVMFRKTSLVTSDVSNTNYAGAMFTEEALGLVIGQFPRVEILPIAGSHTYSIDCTVVFGTATFRPTFGCLIHSSKTA